MAKLVFVSSLGQWSLVIGECPLQLTWIIPQKNMGEATIFSKTTK